MTGYAIGGIIAIVYGLLAGYTGYSLRDDAAQRAALKMQTQDQAQYARLEAKYNVVAADLQKAQLVDQNETKVVTQYIDRIVDRPIYRSDCFDADGLRAANAALQGTAPTGPVADGTVPASHATR